MLALYVIYICTLVCITNLLRVWVSVVSHTIQTYLKDLTEHTRMAFEYSVCLNALVT